MNLFTINTTDSFGKKKKIELRANSVAEALILLKEEGYHAEEKDIEKIFNDSLFNRLKSIDWESRFSSVPKKDILRLIRMIGNSLSRGRTLKESLTFIGENEDNKALKHVILKLRDRMDKPFASQTEIFGLFPRYFDEEFMGIVQAGETSSDLGGYLVDYAKEKERQMVFSSKFKSVLTKRLITFFMVVGVIIVVIAFVIPQFKALFGDKMDVPWAMNLLLTLSKIFRSYGIVFFLLAGGGFGALYYLITHHAKVRWFWHDLLLNLPVLGKTLRTYYTAQFAYLLASLLTKNVDIITAMRIIQRQTKNVCLHQTYENLIKDMQGGDSLFEGIIKENATRPYMISSIVQAAKVGGATASLGACLMDVRQDMEELFENRLDRAIKVFSAVFYLFIMLCALFTAYAIGSAILTFYENAQNLV